MFKLKNKLNKEECLKRLAAENFERTTLSFYRYVQIEDPLAFRNDLFVEWSDLQVLGRVYVAKEGVNAQISVPTHRLEEFRKALYAWPGFEDTFLNIAVEHKTSFWKLTIKIRKNIVAHGLSEGDYDVQNTGNYLSAEEFNQAIEDGAIVVDMRNFYESRIGHFEGAITPDCDTFKEEIPMVLEKLKGKEDKKLLMYCTGGIRCVAVSAYFKSKGFKDVNQLQGGIINYAHQVKENGVESKFKGSNFVFDDRMEERITEDILTECDQCDAKYDHFTNCENKACNLLFVQCPDCAERMQGCCTQDCAAVMELPEEERRAYYAKQKSSTSAEYKSRIRPVLK